MSHSIRRLILASALAVAVAFLALGSATANAGVIVNDNTPSTHQTLTAVVSAPPAGATQYTLAQCNVTSTNANDWGRDCNQSSGTSFSPLSTTNRPVTVDRTFTNFSFVPGLSPLHGMFTHCRDMPILGTSQCGVVVSWYNATFDSLGFATAPLTF
jgi:hypothetical protein